MTASTQLAPPAAPPGRNDLREVLTLALGHHRRGELADAERIYRRVLQSDPTQPDALHLLGVIAMARGDHTLAVQLLRRAVSAAPRMATFYNALGNAHRGLGELDEALASYGQALDLESGRFEVATNMAAALLDRDELEAAETAVRHALDLSPAYPDAHFVLGNVQRARGEHAAAAHSFRQAVASEALLVPALFNLANSLRDQGRVADAEFAYRRVLDADADHLGARFSLGCLLQAQDLLEEAAACFAAVLRRAPAYREVHFQMGVVLQQAGMLDRAVESYREARRLGLDSAELETNLGLALQGLDRLEDAEACQRRAIALDPDAADLQLNLASVLDHQGRFTEAAAACRRALVLRPDYAEAHALLAVVEGHRESPATALNSHRRALALKPDSPAILNEYANALVDAGDLDGAMETYRRALAVAPQSAELHYNMGLALLTAGRLEEGWAEYGWRWQLDRMSLRWTFAVPEWHGESLGDKTLLVWREQGVGDELMFGSCIADLADSGARVIVACTPRLRTLFSRSFPWATVIDEGDLASAYRLGLDYHLPIGGLPRLLRRSTAEFPARRPYLTPAAERIDAWRDRLAALGAGLKVGLCWRSGLLTVARRASYAPLADWRPVLETPGVRFVSLQYDDSRVEIEQLSAATGVDIHRVRELDLKNDLDEAAALTAALDLVISAPTAVGEAAGALGVPVWRVTGGRDWTMLGTEGRPWFPSMEVLMRAPGGSWAAHLDDVADRLRRFPSEQHAGVVR